MTVVYFDTETTGLDPAHHEICQIAAVAIDDRWKEQEAFEVKMTFDAQRADPQALEMNSYEPATWDREAQRPTVGIGMFGQFLRRHASVAMTSKRGKPYHVAQLAGHNIAGFDIPFARQAFRSRELFFPAAFFGLDTLQLASWWCTYMPAKHRPKDLKLPTLAEHLGVPHVDAHNALADVRANIRVAEAMVRALGLDSVR